jgi:hypothetical protein
MSLTAVRLIELSIGNIVRRVMHFIREESGALEAGSAVEPVEPGSARASTRLPSLATLLEVQEAASSGALWRLRSHAAVILRQRQALRLAEPDQKQLRARKAPSGRAATTCWTQ